MENMNVPHIPCLRKLQKRAPEFPQCQEWGHRSLYWVMKELYQMSGGCGATLVVISSETFPGVKSAGWCSLDSKLPRDIWMDDDLGGHWVQM